MKSKAFLALLLLCFVLLPALGQTKPQLTPDDVVKITTNLVQVDVVVTKDGKPVPNLTAEDFEIFEDGKRQTITSFAYISNVSNPSSAPVEKGTTGVTPYVRLQPGEARRIIAFVVDDLGLSADSIAQVRRQMRKFINEQLQPNDLIAIVRTGGELGALQQFTNDKRLLTRAVDQLRWHMCSRVGLSVLQPFGTGDLGISYCGRYSMKSTLKQLRFILDSMGYLPGRKAMVLLSDSLPREDQNWLLNRDGLELRDSGDPGGIPRIDRMVAGSGSDGPSTLGGGLDSVNYANALQKIAEKAIRASVVIYSVDTQGLQVLGPTAADNFTGNGRQLQDLLSSRSLTLRLRREGSELIAQQTGGFQVYNSNNFGLERIMQDQSGYYLLGYRPLEGTFNRRFHHITAKVKRSGMSLRTRFGFFGVSEEETNRSRLTSADMTNLALASPFAPQDIEVDLTSFFWNDKTSGLIVRSFVYIDAKHLTFTPVEGRQQASIELHGVVFGDNGVIVQQLRRGATISLPEPDYALAVTNGMGISIDLPVKKAGAYQVRVAIRDRKSAQIGMAGEFVAVPDLSKNQPAVSGLVLGTVAGDANESMASPGARRFEPNSDLHFAYVIYNASQFANPVMEAKLFRDGKKVYSGPEAPIQLANPTDPFRVFARGKVRLSPDLEPGSYYLQVVITDKGKSKAIPVVQWIDFEIAKPDASAAAPGR